MVCSETSGKGEMQVTHTLHRLKSDLKHARESLWGQTETPPADYIIMTMACQGFNEQDSARRLKKSLALLAEHTPVNISNGEESIHTKATRKELEDNIGDTSYVAAVFDDPGLLIAALKSLAEADLGMSVVVTGNPDQTWPLIERAGLGAHTINLSLGVFGNTDSLPSSEVQALIMMCGHGLITPQLAERIIEHVAAGDMNPEEGAREMASFCTCGIFNTSVAAAILRHGLGGVSR